MYCACSLTLVPHQNHGCNKNHENKLVYHLHRAYCPVLKVSGRVTLPQNSEFSGGVTGPETLTLFSPTQMLPDLLSFSSNF
eukprot:g33639.t1